MVHQIGDVEPSSWVHGVLPAHVRLAFPCNAKDPLNSPQILETGGKSSQVLLHLGKAVLHCGEDRFVGLDRLRLDQLLRGRRLYTRTRPCQHTVGILSLAMFNPRCAQGLTRSLRTTVEANSQKGGIRPWLSVHGYVWTVVRV
jgi:hypothetical protein